VHIRYHKLTCIRYHPLTGSYMRYHKVHCISGIRFIYKVSKPLLITTMTNKQGIRNGVVNWTMNNNTIPSLQPQSEYMSDESLALQQSCLTTTAFANQINRNNDQPYNLSLSGGNGSENLPDWHVDEFFSSSEFGPNQTSALLNTVLLR
jgi:hypothetical protein